MVILIIYAIGGVLALAMAITAWLAQLKTWRLLNEIVISGAIPIVLVRRAKREAERILRMGYIEDHKRLEKTRQFFAKLSDDQEAIQLLHRLDELVVEAAKR